MPLQLNLGHAILRELVLSDALSLALHANDRSIWVQLRDMFSHPYREEDATECIERIQIQNQPTAFALAVSDQVVGVIGLTVQPDINRLSAEIGYWVGAALGKGHCNRRCSSTDDLEHGPVGLCPDFRDAICSQCRLLPGTGKNWLSP